jgi:hypothetical protein
MKLRYIDIATKKNVERSKERESKHVVIIETKGIKLGIHHTQAKPKKTFAITKNGNVDA